MVTAKEVMSASVMTVNTDVKINDVIKLLVKHNVTGLPVVDEEMNLLGMVTEKDVLKALYNKEKVKTVQDLMSPNVTTFDENEDLIKVFKCLVENSFRRVPITSSGKLVGIISRRDIIRFLHKKL
ncbi:MAG: CBS domain-containing protein [Thermodesulfobacteriota bacterium]